MANLSREAAEETAASTSAVPQLELRSVAKRFGATAALRDVSLRIEPRTIHALVGGNGAGKTTLANVISGALSPDEGEVRLRGKAVSMGSPRSALDAGIAHIHQERMLIAQRSVLENVFVGCERASWGLLDRGAQRRVLAELADETGFAIDPDALVGSLRISEQQKVEILRALVRGATLMVFDEPSAALGAGDVEHLHELLRALRNRGVTVVLISHDLREVLSLADRVTVMRDGAAVRTGPAAEETLDSLVSAMIGRDQDIGFPARHDPPSNAEAALRVENLSKRGAFEDISFSVRAGEILGIAGLVGSGRSELLHAIFGSAPADRGTIELDGVRLHFQSPSAAIRAGVALIPEARKEQGLVHGRSVRDNVTLAHLGRVSAHGVIRRGRQRAAGEELLRRVGVDGARLEHDVVTLSGGNQQRVLLAKWLMGAPRVLLADQPTRGVDVGARRGIHDLLVAAANQGVAVVLVSDEFDELRGLAHRLLAVYRGRLQCELHPDVDARELTAAALGHPVVHS
jgi:rhamnose transport system ATP-binding protein